MVFSATFSNISVTVYRGGQFYLCGKPDYLEKTTDLLQYAHDHDGLTVRSKYWYISK
jgi:hypothetical protein